MPASLQIATECRVVVVSPGSQYEVTDTESVASARAQLLAAADAADPPWMLLDLSQTEYFGSTFVGVLFETWLSLKRRKGKLAFCHVNGDLTRVLDCVRLSAVCACYATRAEALAALTK